MSFQWRRLIPRSIRRQLRKGYVSRAARIQDVSASILPALACVDVGASYYPHPRWEIFRRSIATTWLAVDPNAHNLAYLTAWQWPCRVVAVGTALSGDGGRKTLYVTNVDSGSSLSKPTVEDCVRHRIDPGYFFPVTEKSVMTETLETVLEQHDPPGPLLIKLDTQGTELDILKGLGAVAMQERVICVELESTLLACPLYEDTPSFGTVQHFMESNGFELAALKPIPGSLPAASAKLRSQHVLIECDAVFLLRPDNAAGRPLDHRIAMLGCYVAYELYGEALHLLRLLRGGGEAPIPPELEALQRLLS